MMNSRPTRKPERRGPFLRMRKGLSRIAGSKGFLIACSLMLAIFAWGALIASDGSLTRQKVIASAVSVTGADALKSRGFIVVDDVPSLIPDARMTVEVTQANYARASATIYNPHIDLNSITSEGEIAIPVSFSSQLYGPVTSVEPASVTVHVERYITRRIPVVLEYIGQAPEGMFLDIARTEPLNITVSGPASIVSTIARAAVRLDKSQLSAERMTDKSAMPIELQSSGGEPIQSRLLQVTNQSVITDSVIVETECVPVKRLPLDISTLVSGTPEEGYELEEILPAQSSMDVAAQPEVLDTMESIVADTPLSIDGASADVTGFARLRRMTNVENNIPLDMEVTAKIREKTVERTFRSVEIEADGLGSEQRASLSSGRITVQLTGGYHFINSLSREDIRLYVDVSGLEEGKYELPVQIRIDNAENFSCALGVTRVGVTIRNK